MTTHVEALPAPAPLAHPPARWRALLAWSIAALVTGGLAVGALELRKGRAKAPALFEALPITEGPLQAQVTANGTLSALVTVQVGSQVSGRIQRLHVDYNSPVKKRQVIAEIDPLLFRAAVEQASANYAAASGNLVKAQAQAVDAHRQYVRQEQLFQRSLVAQADRDTAEANDRAAAAQVEAYQGAVKQAKAARDQAQINLDYTKIISPIDGVVISRNVDVGQTVAAAFQAPTLFLIAQDLREMQVDTSVAEADVGRLSAGMAATFTVDAYPSDVFRGAIRQVRKNPQTVQNVVTYDAVIDVRNDDLKLFPGMTANVTVVYADRARAVRIPNAALRYRPPAELAASAGGRRLSAGERLVWRLQGTRPEPVVIRPGVSDGSFTELLTGSLSPGDRLVTETLAGPKGSAPGGFGRVF